MSTASLLVWGALIIGALAGLLFFACPRLDLATSEYFYRGNGVFAGKGGGVFSGGPPQTVADYARLVLYFSFIGICVLNVVGLISSIVLKRNVFGLGAVKWLFLALSLALGPGLVGNTILKDHWGRARPVHLEEFGGSKSYSPPLLPSNQCPRNCSFVAGEASMMYATFFAAAFLFPGIARSLILAGVAFGLFSGFIRVTQGAHFLSDVIFAGVAMALTVSAIYFVFKMLVQRRSAKLGIQLQDPSTDKVYGNGSAHRVRDAAESCKRRECCADLAALIVAVASPAPDLEAATVKRQWLSANNLLLAVALGLTVLRLAVAAYTGLVDDEAYYRIWSLAPSLSYLDHPPMVAWIIGAGRAIAGDGTLGIRLFAPLFVLAGAAVLWRTALLLYGPDIARRAVWFMLAMPLLAVGGIVITPDLPSVLFAGLVIWGLAELDRSRNAQWWLAIGLFAGLGLLSKYTNLFLGATIVLWLLATPENRRWFSAPQLWIGGIVAAVVASPVVIWNAEHGWASFIKQFGRVGHDGKAGLSYIVELIGGFALLESPLIALLALIGFVGVVRRAASERSRSDVLLTAAIVPMLLYFCIHALHDRVQGNWPGPLYPFFAICAACGLDALPSRWRTPAFVSALVVGFAMMAVIYVHALHPLVHAPKDPTEQMRGWPGLADAIEKKREETGAAWLATSSYATTGQLMYGIKGRSPVAQLDERIRYLFLPPLPDAVVNRPALYVELERRVDLPLLRKKFRKIEKIGTLMRHNGSGGATYVLYLVSDPVAPPLAMDDKL